MSIPKLSSSRSLIILIAGNLLLLALVQHLIVGKFFTDKPPPPSIAPAEKPAVKVTAGLPLRLQIPKIGVAAPIERVGLTESGDLSVPSQRTIAGWYDQGPRPGDDGSAVIDGHFGWVDNKPAIFDNLHKLRAGDRLHIEDDKGQLITFVVKATRTYNPNEDATVVFRSSDGKSHLNLVTCQGVWNTGLQGYETRLVVFTDRE